MSLYCNYTLSLSALFSDMTRRTSCMAPFKVMYKVTSLLLLSDWKRRQHHLDHRHLRDEARRGGAQQRRRGGGGVARDGRRPAAAHLAPRPVAGGQRLQQRDAAALDLPREAALAQGAELVPANGPDGTPTLARAAAASGTAHSALRHVVVAGSRRLLNLTETPSRSGGTIGFALDRTDLESAESDLSRHVNAHGQVLESIHAAAHT